MSIKTSETFSKVNSSVEEEATLPAAVHNRRILDLIDVGAHEGILQDGVGIAAADAFLEVVGVGLVDGVLWIGEGVIIDEVRLLLPGYPQRNGPRLHGTADVAAGGAAHSIRTAADTSRNADLSQGGFTVHSSAFANWFSFSTRIQLVEVVSHAEGTATNEQIGPLEGGARLLPQFALVHRLAGLLRRLHVIFEEDTVRPGAVDRLRVGDVFHSGVDVSRGVAGSSNCPGHVFLEFVHDFNIGRGCLTTELAGIHQGVIVPCEDSDL